MAEGMCSEKRERSANFTQADKEHSMQLVLEKYFAIIESKKTDAASIAITTKGLVLVRYILGRAAFVQAAAFHLLMMMIQIN
ncbi:hypothetical protein ILUMI_18818 [Ignelater luminosus]|uniref:Uncharacterized protein n=1 Tax=Ignelater luminosus TaxID=2038154 RepID=A0A8K0G0I2_IGNLU|nr:hypothetical protein ILUMI_18818 [Ignelater luminosus]